MITRLLITVALLSVIIAVIKLAFWMANIVFYLTVSIVNVALLAIVVLWVWWYVGRILRRFTNG